MGKSRKFIQTRTKRLLFIKGLMAPNTDRLLIPQHLGSCTEQCIRMLHLLSLSKVLGSSTYVTLTVRVDLSVSMRQEEVVLEMGRYRMLFSIFPKILSSIMMGICSSRIMVTIV